MEINLIDLATRKRINWHGLHIMSGHGQPAVLFAPCPDGWRVYSLTSKFPVTVNEERIASGHTLHPGDQVAIAGKPFFVESMAIECRAVNPTATRCRVRTAKITLETETELLVGHHSSCRLCLSRDEGVEPFHALLAPIGGEWVLHPLTSHGIKGEPGARPASVEIQTGTTVTLGEVALSFEILDKKKKTPPTEEMPTIHNEGDTPSTTTHGIYVDAMTRDPLFQKAATLCAQVITGSVKPPASASKGMLSRLRGPRTPEEQLERLHEQLAGQPANPRLIVALVAVLQDRPGPLYLDLCRKLLYRILQLNPGDVESRLSLGRVCFIQAQDKTRAIPRRLKEYETAERAVREVLHHREDDLAVQDLLAEITTNLGLLRSGLDALNQGT